MTAIIITDQALLGIGLAHELNGIAPSLEATCFPSVTAALAFLHSGTTEACCAVVDLDVRDGARMLGVLALRSIAPTLPLVVLTALRREHEALHAHELQCAAYLDKAADLGCVAATLAAVLQQHATV